MISYLRGRVKNRGEDYLILEVANVGYRVFVTKNLLDRVKEGSELELYTYQFVRDDAIDLYGFSTIEELKFFEQLNTVSGIGPRSALAVLEAAPVEEIVKAVLAGDKKSLVGVYGLNEKKAEKIILELKNKVTKLEAQLVAQGRQAKSRAPEEINLVEALVGLGYSAEQARMALRELPEDLTKPEERLRAALKVLGKK